MLLLLLLVLSQRPEAVLVTIYADADYSQSAMSVWMFHNTSPAAMLSPSAMYHLTIMPSTMVGERLGILITVPGLELPDA